MKLFNTKKELKKKSSGISKSNKHTKINEKRKCDSVLEIGNRKSLFYPIKNQLKLFTFQLFDFLSSRNTNTGHISSDNQFNWCC